MENSSTWLLLVHGIIFVYKPWHIFVYSFKKCMFKKKSAIMPTLKIKHFKFEKTNKGSKHELVFYQMWVGSLKQGSNKSGNTSTSSW